MSTRTRWLGMGMLSGLVLLTGVAIWQTRQSGAAPLLLERRPPRVMGTSCRLVVTVDPDGRHDAEETLDAAEELLRDMEARLSVHLEASELGRFNAAGAGVNTSLSADTLDILDRARRATVETAGAFDPTAAPLFRAWKRAGAEQRRPTSDELSLARDQSGWDELVTTSGGLQKAKDEAGVDLGGIAKGTAVDRVVALVRERGQRAGLVQIGGETRAFGAAPVPGGAWDVGIRSPFADEIWARIRLDDRAVSTSGNYHRFVEIDGRRYSHIVDPRTGEPADAVPSVTVVAPTTEQADIWSTALSILGPDGLERLPPGLEALLILGTPESNWVAMTPGMRHFLAPP